MPFDLHPEYPPEGIPRDELRRRYGGDYDERMRARFAQEGLGFAPGDVVPRSLDALRLTELARERGLHGPVHDRLMEALWEEGLDLGDHGVLAALAAEAGLDGAEAERVLAGDDYADRVQASTAYAASIGITGIPGFLLDQRLLVLGAQPLEVFERAFERLTLP